MAKLCENDIFARTDEKRKLKPKTGLIEITEPLKNRVFFQFTDKVVPVYARQTCADEILSLFLCVS